MAQSRGAARLADLDARQRRAVAIWSIARIAVLSGLVLVLYALWPIRPVSAPAWEVVRMLVAGLAFAVIFVVALRRITRAELPEARGIQTLVLLAVIFVALASVFYLEIGAADPSAFSEPMDKIGAFYFSTTVLTTVGFGDIHPVSSGARLAVTGQMVMDLVFVGVAARLVVAAVRSRFDRADDDPASPDVT